MVQTELLQIVIRLADKLRTEAQLRVCPKDYYYIALRELVDKPEYLEGVNFDKSELKELESIIDNNQMLTIDEVLNRIQNVGYTGTEDDWVKFKRWIYLSNRDTVEVFNKIAPDFISKDKIEKSKNNEIKKKKALEEGKHIVETDGTIRSLTKEATELRETLLEYVVGQNYAVNKFVSSYFRGEIAARTDEDRKGPRALYLFLGRPGVGKTFLAQKAAETIGRPCLKVDMSCGACDVLSGLPKEHKGREFDSFKSFVKTYPKCMIVFDEIEKANVQTILTFLAILDIGVSDGVDYRDAIVIFTTNAGSNLYSNNEYGRLSSIPDGVIYDALEKDVDPLTRRPYFPPEIVSRMGTGTFILFDNLSANSLIYMADREISRNVKNIESEFSMTIKRDMNLSATTLFTIGGNADGRNTVTSSRKFFLGELFELFRLIQADKGEEALDNIKEIDITVSLDDAPDDVKVLFDNDENINIVIFADDEVKARVSAEQFACGVKCVSTIEEYSEMLCSEDVTVAIVDYNFGKSEDDILNAEDMDSIGRDAFELTKKESPETILFVLDNEKSRYNREEIMSFISSGAQDMTCLDKNVKGVIEEICMQACQQNALDTLRFKHKVISYNTLQTVSEDASKAEITLYDLKLDDAVEAEDRKNIMSADEKPDLSWDDIVIPESVRNDLQFYIDYLKNPKEITRTLQRAPRGVLLYGPPGTGKTSIAKVLASQAGGISFLAYSGSGLMSKWASETTQNVHEMFATARKYAPAILFIDEIDSIGSKRTSTGNDSGGASRDFNATVTALLTEMDGFKTSGKKPVFVVAATNHGGRSNEDQNLDPALVRRFDRSIFIDYPDRDARKKVFELLRRKNPKVLQISDSIIDNLADRSIGESPSSIESAVMTAIRDAIRAGGVVTDEILDEAFEKYSAGEEKKWDPSELYRTCIHEAGHCLIAHYYGEKPNYLTVVARDDHGGYMLSVGNEKKGTRTKAELTHMICKTMGGRAAEMVYFGDEDGVSSGASGDLRQATVTARRMICDYGMDDEAGLISLDALGLSGSEFETRITSRISDILSEQLETAKTIISDNKIIIDRMAEALQKKNYLTAEEIQEVFDTQK